MNIVNLEKIEQGATIGFLNVCAPIQEQEKIAKAKKYFEDKGYKVVLSETTYTNNGITCGTDKDRVKALEDFFANPAIDAILCTRGGYGALRIVEKLNYALIGNNPKYFGGFSDATALLVAINKHAGIETYHAPMPYCDFGDDEISEFTEKSFFSSFEQIKEPILLHGTTLIDGEARGILWGGNLTTLASMVGFDFIPDEKFILFIEDINEPAYKIDRCLTQLSFCPEFGFIQGLVVGDFTGVDEPKYLENIFTELGEKYAIPVITGLKVGHIKDKYTLPIGRECVLSTKKQTIEFWVD